MREDLYLRELLVALLAALFLLTSQPAAAQDATPQLVIDEIDTASYPEVEIVVTAPDELAGSEVPAEAFRVAEDGVLRPFKVRRLPTDELEVVLLLDTSGSMSGGPLLSAKFAALGFVQNLPGATQVAVLGFGSSPEIAAGFTSDQGAAVAAVESLEAQGETALYDAIAVALEQFSAGDEVRRSLVLLSDGGDTVSASDLDEAVDALAAADVDFYAVELESPENDQEAIAQLAAAADGRVVAAADPDALLDIYSRIAAEIVNRYEITYLSEGSGPTSTLIAVSHEGKAALVLQTIEYPAAPVAVPDEPDQTAPPAPAEEVPAQQGLARFLPSVGFLASASAFWIGVALLFTSLAVALFLTIGSREKKIRLADRVATPATGERTFLGGLADGASRLAERALQAKGKPSRLNAWLERAGVMLRPGEFVVFVASIAVTGLAVGFLLVGPALGVLLAGVAVGIALVRVKLLAERRKTAFADQLEDTLLLLSGTMRAGYGLMQAVDAVANEAPSPTGDEFRRVVAETRLGRDLDVSLDALVGRVDNQDFEWIVQAIKIQREVGGDLAEVLDTVAGTIRERNRIRRQIKALSAEGRMSAAILIPLPILVGVVIFIINPDYIGELFTTLPGQIMLGVSAVLMVIGGIWISRIVKLVF